MLVGERKLKNASGLECLVRDLERRSYSRTADYINNAQTRMFSYVRLWLETGPPNQFLVFLLLQLVLLAIPVFFFR